MEPPYITAKDILRSCFLPEHLAALISKEKRVTVYVHNGLSAKEVGCSRDNL